MKPLLFLTALIGLAACDTGVESRKEAVPPAERPAPRAAVASLFFSVIGGGTSVQRDVRTFWRSAGPLGQTVDLLSKRHHVMHRSV